MTGVDSAGSDGGDENVDRPATTDESAASVHVTDPSEAFQALGNDVRTEILATMLDRTGDAAGESRVSFSTLFETASVDTTAGFAYHLDELVGPYLEKDADGYALTYAGRTVARTIESGTYTRRVDRDPVAIDDPCPFCEAPGLEASVDDNAVTIACRRCERPVLEMDFPPAGLEAHDDDLPSAFDSHHRHRIALLGDGVCPECGGSVDGSVDVVRPARLSDGTRAGESAPDPVLATFDCQACGYDLRSPVAVTLLDHPAVVAFFRDHDESVAARPIWNVGREWTETPLSHEPMAVRVAVTLDDETLECYVDGDRTVVDTRRAGEADAAVERDDADETVATAEPAPEADVA